jgi:two-component system, chemotaxis family, CheB/CheR fusion protein
MFLRRDARAEGRDNLRELTEKALLLHYAQAGVLVNGRGEILHLYGRTGKYLEPAPGDAGMNILTMAREGLRRELTPALHRAVSRKEQVECRRLRVRTNGELISVNLAVQPVASITGQTAVHDLFLVILEEAPPTGLEASGKEAAGGGERVAADIDERIAVLEQELRAKEEYLQTTIEEMVTSNEELKSTNEEMQSVNEELQSTNEELETSKEELQSVNEELATVNSELETKVADLSRANNDMNNLMAGTGVGTLFVDYQLRISRFTPDAAKVINLIQTDIGRPVGHLVSNPVSYDSLVEDVQSVLNNLVPLEAEVQTKAGVWHLMRIRPYRTLENVIEGAVITFVDITQRKRAEDALQEAQTLAENILATVREPLLVLDQDFCVVSANRAFCSKFRVTRGETEGRLLFDLGNGQWNIPKLRGLLEEILPEKTSYEDYEVTHEFEKVGQWTMLLNARRIVRERGKAELILLAMEDITKYPLSGRG